MTKIALKDQNYTGNTEKTDYKPYKCILITFLFAFTSALHAQDITRPGAYQKTIVIDSIIIKPAEKPRNIMAELQLEPLSLTPATSNISYGEISKQGAVTLIDAMNHIPGSFTETRGRQVKQFFSVRGQKYPYPDYAINGVWQKEFEELPYFFSASDIEEIEIVRSSAALLTGLSGLSGLINIKTRQYDSPETDIEMEYGTFGTIHSHVSHGSRIGGFSYAAGAGFDKTNGPEGKHAEEAMTNLNTRIDWQLSDKLGIKANLFYLDGRRQIALAEPPADQRYINMIQSFDPYSAILSNVKLTYRPSSKYSSELQLLFAHRNPLFINEVNELETTSSEKDYEFGFNFIQGIELSASNTLRFGGLYSRWIAPNGKRFYTEKKCDTETISVVITDEQKFGKLTVDGGIRLNKTYLNEYAAFNIEGDGAVFRTVTPLADIWEPALVQGSLGVSYRISDSFSAFLSNAAGQLKPRSGTLTDEMEIPLTENRLKSDLGIIKKFSGTGRITTSLFAVWQKNAITFSGKSYLDPETEIRRELYLNRDQKQWGVEFELLAPALLRSVRPFFNLTYMRSLMEEEGEIVLNKENPAFISSAGFYSQLKTFDFNLFFKYVAPFENDRFASGPQPLGDFLVSDFNAGYTLSGKADARFYVRIKNLTDLRYSTVNGYPDFGRMLFGGVEIKFGK